MKVDPDWAIGAECFGVFLVVPPDQLWIIRGVTREIDHQVVKIREQLLEVFWWGGREEVKGNQETNI